MRTRTLLVAALVALVSAAPSYRPRPVPPPSDACAGPDRRAVSGPQRAWSTPLDRSATLRARGASWVGTDAYAVTFEGTAPSSCLSHGTLIGTWNDTDAWSRWHGRGAIRFSQPRFSVIGVHVVNNGDGVKAKDAAGGSAQDFTIRGSWIQHVHDDCVENDYLHSGVIRNNLFDGCYVLFSARPWRSGIDGRTNLLQISRNVAALEPMRSVFRGPGPGTGGFFKWSADAPGVVLTDNVLMASQVPNHGTLDPPTGPLLCARNVIVWTGAGPFPSAAAWRERCPDTVITTDGTRFTKARQAWMKDHPRVG